MDKARLAVVFLCNADGSDKYEPIIIGNSAKPGYFRVKSGADPKFRYHLKKAWMTKEETEKVEQQENIKETDLLEAMRAVVYNTVPTTAEEFEVLAAFSKLYIPHRQQMISNCTKQTSITFICFKFYSILGTMTTIETLCMQLATISIFSDMMPTDC
ncbi:serine palmitoyltransferase component [Mucor velutinosus]|uniref:Serine palmitoyltransferase component n=1 Tax=Mucor velutinosus TaxID=708070 RepID=A0AAN7D3J3_9FUNG|nr:serine palmitoyltransferase component [Mucor velutinosus]